MAAYAEQLPGYREEAGMTIGDQTRDGWTVVLRRRPARIVDGRADGPCTGAFEIICCNCGDDPDLDYSAVSPRLQLVSRAIPDRGGRPRIPSAPQAAHPD
jgi:hypothetical protein